MKHKYTLLRSILPLALAAICTSGLHAQCSPNMVTTLGGDTAVYTCPGDQVADIIMLSNSAPPVEQFAYIVTDDQNMILEVPGDVPSIDVEDAGPGICRVWGLTYSGTLTAAMGQDLMEAGLATGCTELSGNFISLYRDMPDAGSISIQGGGTTTTVTTGDGMPDVVHFTTTTASLSNYAWIITDDQSMILGVEHEPMHDFEPAGPGTCLVYGVSYTGTLNAPMGGDVTMLELSDDCYDLSTNHLTVVRLSVGILEKPELSPLHMYPTVASDMITIDLGIEAARGAGIRFLDAQGRLVKEVPLNGSQDRVVISVADLIPGIYSCDITTLHGRATGRFIKE